LNHEQALFLSLETLLGKFLNLDHLISLCIQVSRIWKNAESLTWKQIPKAESAKQAENKIQHIIFLKSSLELVAPLRQALAGIDDPLISTFHHVLEDERYEKILGLIGEVITPETHFEVVIIIVAALNMVIVLS
jgi:DNA mismatch repair protein MSH4